MGDKGVAGTTQKTPKSIVILCNSNSNNNKSMQLLFICTKGASVLCRLNRLLPAPKTTLYSPEYTYLPLVQNSPPFDLFLLSFLLYWYISFITIILYFILVIPSLPSVFMFNFNISIIRIKNLK